MANPVMVSESPGAALCDVWSEGMAYVALAGAVAVAETVVVPSVEMMLTAGPADVPNQLPSDVCHPSAASTWFGSHVISQ
jgi:hypothetical protein